MAFQNILLEQPEPGIYLLTISRPKALNALNSATLDEIAVATDVVAEDPGARVLLVTGAGEKAFVAGADITEMQNFTPGQGEAFSAHGSRAFAKLEALPLPVIALVNGYALGGGCELALACDWIIASERAVFGQPEVNLGVCAGFGGTQRLPRRIGPARALELLCTGRQINAEEAAAIGVANRVVPAAGLRQTGLDMARVIAGMGPAAVRYTKEAVRRGAELGLAAALALESQYFGRCCATQDQKEGMKAFVEKRPPRFTGR
ncbi:MAG: enoyl-CoA hydratase/isomerase family protein [Betaproteobacteria bacterium]|nr:enoyl-CoA hydratase/isomerase family protein [Betaproteobacteria bacterium]